MSCDIVFLEASDEVLIRRYSENRRRHPIAKPGRLRPMPFSASACSCRVRDRADMIIDTSRLRTSCPAQQIAHGVLRVVRPAAHGRPRVLVWLFKHGMPVEADIMIDVRFLPNPFYDPEMRTMTGLDKRSPILFWTIPRRRSFGRLGHSCSIRLCRAISRRVSRSFLSPSAARAASTAALPLPSHGPLPGRRSVSCEHLPPRPVTRQHEGIGLHVVYR